MEFIAAGGTGNPPSKSLSLVIDSLARDSSKRVERNGSRNPCSFRGASSLGPSGAAVSSPLPPASVWSGLDGSGGREIVPSSGGSFMHACKHGVCVHGMFMNVYEAADYKAHLPLSF